MLWIGTSWKMNVPRSGASAYAETLARSVVVRAGVVQPFVIPPFTSVAEVAAALANTRVRVGVQNVHWADDGPWTGEISGSMASACGATLAEIGHSERRTSFGETDETVAHKVAAARRHGLTPLICVGDSASEYAAGETAEVIARQARASLSQVPPEAARDVLIAYEPVWSIGEGGVAADPAFIERQHAQLKVALRHATGCDVRVLYGGSVGYDNCLALTARPNVDGLFIGRAAWTIEGYLAILERVVASLR